LEWELERKRREECETRLLQHGDFDMWVSPRWLATRVALSQQGWLPFAPGLSMSLEIKGH